MNGPIPGDERARQLMMAALDGEIDAAGQADLDRLLAGSRVLQEEWQRMQRVKEVTSTMELKNPPEEVWDDYWDSVYNRVERGLGWILASIGSIVLLTFAAWKWVEAIWGETQVPLFVKIAVFLLMAGFVVLAVSVVRERLFTWRRDPYKEVKR